MKKDDAKKCPPCFYVHHNKSSLHIVPYDIKDFFFIFNYSYKTKLLGIIPISKIEPHFVAHYKLKDFHSLIKLFASDNKKEILYIGTMPMIKVDLKV